MKYISLSILLFVFLANNIQAQDLFLSSVEKKEIVNKSALGNPDRGLHLECNFVITDTKEPTGMFNPYGSGVGQILDPDEEFEYFPNGFIKTRTEELKVEEDSIKLTQLYMYLQDFRETDQISENGIKNIETLFEVLRESGYKAILRFAYRNEHTLPKNLYPTADQTISQIKQLAPIIAKNIDVISVIQSGFLGQWGEWNPDLGSTAKNNEAMVELLKGIPDGYGMEMRYCSRKNNLKSAISTADYNRIGFNNDYFTGGQHPMACGGSDFCIGTSQYTQVASESFAAYVSGEVPHEGKTDPTWGLDFMLDTDALFQYLKMHHYVALDVTQNFYNNIKHWRTQKVFPSKLDRLNVFYDESYFLENDEIVARSFYQFVRDHLGYRLNIKNVDFSKVGDNMKYDIKLTNTGFATVHNPKSVYMVFINKGNNTIEKEIKLENVNPKSWQPWASGKPTELLTHTISGEINPELTGKYKVALAILDNQESIQDNPDYQIKFSPDNGNVTHWRNAENKRVLNILGEINL
ncbi:DUF4832 domain-containing protein [Bacteroidales bacterium OttesenSCG-928-M06]|nr:DUF4832 domain-containing protein [Bacteroidales bacterium OttesenSCG-928-M06]